MGHNDTTPAASVAGCGGAGRPAPPAKSGDAMTNILHQLERAEDDALLAHLRSEVERLRLTDPERVAVMWAIATLETDAIADAGQNAEAAATLRDLLARHDATGHR